MLISSLIIFPALIAMRLQRSFSGVIIAAAITAVIDFLLGLVISFLLSTPTGASIVLVNLCVLLIVTAIQKIPSSFAPLTSNIVSPIRHISDFGI